MKRDEALLKKALSEAEKYKRQLQNVKPKERLIVQPVAMPGAKGDRKPGDTAVPDAEEIQNQFLDKLTSKFENFFAVEDGGEGA